MADRLMLAMWHRHMQFWVEPGRRQAPAYEAVERIEPYHSQHLDLTPRSVSSGPFELKLSDGRPAGRPTESLGRPALHVLFLN